MFKELYKLRKEIDTNNHVNIPNNDDPFYTNDDNDNYYYDHGDGDGDNNNYYYDHDDDDSYNDDKNEDNEDNNEDNDEDDDDENDKIPPFVQSMKILDKHIQQIEKSIQFIKGKYKYTFIKILFKLKLQYRQDTVRLVQYWINGFI